LTGRIQTRRRGRDIGLAGLLVERDAELELLRARLADACAGTGGVIIIEAPAGNGKSRLLTVAGDLARESGMRVLGANASELERDFPFGVAIQLFEPCWMAADAEERMELLEGPASRAGELLSGSLADRGPFPGDQGYAVIHALFWLTRNLAALPRDEVVDVPLVMLVDGGQWADRPSLRFLAYLAERIDQLPIVLVLSTREGEPMADPPALPALRTAADDGVLRPGSLSEEGVAAVIRSRFPDAAPALWRACMRVTGGNPFLLMELLDELQADGAPPNSATAARLADVAPESVLNSVIARLGAMPSAVRQVASAVGIFGDASVEQVARLTALESEQVRRAADALAGVHLFHSGTPLSFVHPLVSSAVCASMSPLERGEAHRHAALIMREDGRPDEQVAAHLLASPPHSDPLALQTLRSAARTAMASGAAETAVRLLRRGLAEQPPPELLPEVLGELGQAELGAGLPDAMERLEEAIGAAPEQPQRAQLALTHGEGLYRQGRYRDAAQVLSSALDGLVDADQSLADELEAAYVAAGSLVPTFAEDATDRGRALVARFVDQPSAARRDAVAHMAVRAAIRGDGATRVLELADLAWGDGALLESQAPDGLGWPLLTGALLFADELERDLEVCDAVLEAARARDSAASEAVARHCRAWALYEQGRIVEAFADARAALDAAPDAWPTYVRTAYGAIACCHLQRGELERAEQALAAVEHPDVCTRVQLPFLLEARAQLRLAQLRPADALEDALKAGRVADRRLGGQSPGAIAWRSTAALAYLAVGERAEARRLATEELEQARRTGITRVAIRDLRVLGLAERGADGIKLLREAVQTGERHPPRLEQIHALVDLGAALRRANRRTAAREPLRRALELSHRGGAAALEDRARDELFATGARPRRAVLTGVESLTPSELRVGELAARGLTTRQIAEALFVTPKTVEFHLRHIYQKLNIGSRGELAAELGEGRAGS
jgi:DNA-binding CsgD family transcriptional regulator